MWLELKANKQTSKKSSLHKSGGDVQGVPVDSPPVRSKGGYVRGCEPTSRPNRKGIIRIMD